MPVHLPAGNRTCDGLIVSGSEAESPNVRLLHSGNHQLDPNRIPLGRW
jgi:hypothetical protein